MYINYGNRFIQIMLPTCKCNIQQIFEYFCKHGRKIIEIPHLMFQFVSQFHFLMPYMKHTAPNKELSEISELLILIQKDDFNTVNQTGKMDFAITVFWFGRFTEKLNWKEVLKEIFSHLYCLGHCLCLRVLCSVCGDDVIRKLGSDSIKTDNFRAITHWHRFCLRYSFHGCQWTYRKSGLSCLNTGSWCHLECGCLEASNSAAQYHDFQVWQLNLDLWIPPGTANSTKCLCVVKWLEPPGLNSFSLSKLSQCTFLHSS